MTGKPGKSDYELADRVHSAAIHLLRRIRLEDRASGLSAPRLSALSVLVFGGPRSVGSLARAEQVKAPTMSRLLKDMEYDGLIKRHRDKRDERVVRIQATAKGKALMEAGRQRRVEALSAELGKLSQGERKILDRASELLAGMGRGSE